MFSSRLVQLGLLGGAGLSASAAAATVAYQTNAELDLSSIGIVRLGRATCTVFNIAYFYKTNLFNKNLDPDSKQYQLLRSQTHKQAAEQLLNLCCANRGIYIKVGQHIGALEYLLPKEYVDTMQILHSHAPNSKLEDIYNVLKQEFKKDPLEIFSEFDPEPLGTASLAQVHKAKLKDGTTVAVKVQHPYVKDNSLLDMKTMELLVKMMSWVFPNFKFQWLVDESKRNIPIELDFTIEAKNAEKVKKIFKNETWLKVPKVYYDLSTPRVLTMEFVEGGQVNDLQYIKKNRIDPFDISRKLGYLYSNMIFIHGFVHSDPHPGNILVRKSTKGTDIILLDHGLYANLSHDFRNHYSNLWLSILNSDRNGMQKYSDYLGVGEYYGLFVCMISGRSWQSVLSGLEKTKFTNVEKEVFQKDIPIYLPEISDCLQKVNRQMLLVLKTNDLLRGIETTLKTCHKMYSFQVMTTCCIKSIYNEKCRQNQGLFARCWIRLIEYWILVRLFVYYKIHPMIYKIY